MSFQPWDDPANNRAEARKREMSLPPQFRFPGKQRDYRDALLASMILHVEATPKGKNLEETIAYVCLRNNLRATLVGKTKALKAQLSEKQIEEATNAARIMYSWELDKARRKVWR